MYSSALRRVCWLNDPCVSFGFSLLELLKVCMKVMKFVRENIGVRYEVKLLFPELFLHFYKVKAQPIFACYFIAHWEMIDALKLIKAFVKKALARAARPKDVPFVRVSEVKAICF